MHKVACEACGYTARAAAKWLDTHGAPLCPCNGEPMRDCREGIEHDVAAGDPILCPRVHVLRKRFVRVRKVRHCERCGRVHEPRALMHAETTDHGGRIGTHYYCAEGCDAEIDYSGDGLPWEPETTFTDWF